MREGLSVLSAAAAEDRISAATGGLTGFILKQVGSPVAAFNDESFWECEPVEVQPVETASKVDV